MAQNRQMSLFQETETEDYQKTEEETTNFDIERNCFKHLQENLSAEILDTLLKHRQIVLSRCWLTFTIKLIATFSKRIN
ncbi:hypothetical protein F4Z98_13680 [Candidatus Poribacteria bacterium]|nr:hypothetical protein [Candidatus Poribacteria bacterium]